MRMSQAKIGHQQPRTPVATYNEASTRIFNRTAKQKYLAIDMRFYWIRDRIRQNYFRILWEEGKNQIGDYFTKHHPIWHHITMRPKYVKATKKDTENSKDRQTATVRGCAGTTNPGITRKLENPLK